MSLISGRILKMPSYKFTNCEGRCRGELTRYVFYATGKEFEDVQVQFENWPSVKPSSPFGQMPFLEVDGKVLAQSNAIARFLAREFGLAGMDSWEQGQVDQYTELAEDMFKHIDRWFFESDEQKKEELKKDLDEVVPIFCRMFEKALGQNGGKFFVGGELTLADLAVLNIFDTPMLNNPNLLDSFPKLEAHRKFISSLPGLSSYIKNRKHSDI